METVLPFLCGAMVSASIYLMLSGNLIRFIFGLVLAGNAINLLLFTAGRLSTSRPPLVPESASVPDLLMANALPQALILTAIVIGFSLLTFVFILFYRTYQTLGTVDTEAMRFAEPVENDAVSDLNAGKGRVA